MSRGTGEVSLTRLPALRTLEDRRVVRRRGARPLAPPSTQHIDRSPTVYAIVRSGGHQHKVQVGDTLSVDRVQRGSR